MKLSDNAVVMAHKFVIDAECRDNNMYEAARINPLDMSLGWIAAAKQLVYDGILTEQEFTALLRDAATRTNELHVRRLMEVKANGPKKD